MSDTVEVCELKDNIVVLLTLTLHCNLTYSACYNPFTGNVDNLLQSLPFRNPVLYLGVILCRHVDYNLLDIQYIICFNRCVLKAP